MAVLTVNAVDRTGTLDPVLALTAAAAGGDSFPNTGFEYVIFQNLGGGTITVTAVIQSTVDGQVVTSRTFTVLLTSGYRIVGPFPVLQYNDGQGRMNFTYSGVTSFKVGVFKNATT